MLFSRRSIVYWYSPVARATRRRSSGRLREQEGGRGGPVAVARGRGEQAQQVLVVGLAPVEAVEAPLLAIVGAQGLADAPEGVDRAARLHGRGHARQLTHRGVDVFELAQRGPARVALGPRVAGREPDREGLREVLVRMALRVVPVEVDHEAAAVGTGQVELRIGLGAAAEQGPAAAARAQVIRVFDGVTRLVAQDAQAPLRRPALDLQRLFLLEPGQARVGQVERDGEAGHAVRAEPFPGQPGVGAELQAAAGQLGPELVQVRLERAALEGHPQVAHADVEQALVVVGGPERLAAAGGRGTRRTGRGAAGRSGARRGAGSQVTPA